jgi:hypothetical protein
MGGGLESRCVGRVYGADGAVHGMPRNLVSCSSVYCSMAVKWRRVREIKFGSRRYKKWYRNLLGNRKAGERRRMWEMKLKLIGADIKN